MQQIQEMTIMNKMNPFAVLAVLALAACDQRATDEPAVAEEAVSGAAELTRTASPAGASVFFISPADGDTVSNPVPIEFGIEGMDVVKAGQEQPRSGHHHLIIDAALPVPGWPIPADEHYVHFGDASTSTALTLDPGSHTLQLLLGDHRHIPHAPPVISGVITVIVE